MAMSITHNLMAVNAGRMFKTTNRSKAKSTEKLSSGYRINRAADDAAGLAISEKMRRQIRGLHQGADNIQDGVGYVQVADGALNEAQDIMQRINELSVKAANGTNTDEDRAYIDQEVQALKKELTRIFGTTSFNERLIWKPTGTEETVPADGVDPNRELIGWTTAQAAWFLNTSEEIDVTNDNCGVIAYNYYAIHADAEKGMWVTWTGYDGNDYETEPVSWEKLKEDNYSFEMSDYFGDKTDNKLYDADGDPVFKHQISFAVHSKATLDDIIKCLDGAPMWSDPSVSVTGNYEDALGGELPNRDVQLDSVTLYYSAAYASNHNTGTGDSSSSQNIHDFDAGDDVFLEPRDAAEKPVQNQTPPAGHGNLTFKPGATTVEEARNSTEGWEFSFYMDGIGKVTARSASVSYWATSDFDPDDEHEYWQWEGRWEGSGANRHWNPHYQQRSIKRTIEAGRLGDVMAVLTGRKGSSTPGLLTYENGGHADGGGMITISFDLTAEEAYAYGKDMRSYGVGSLSFSIKVSNTDTEETILQKIQDAFNENTILDIHSSSGLSDSEEIGRPYENDHRINVDPIYRDEVEEDDIPDEPVELPENIPTCNFFVQAGPEAGMHIDIEYQALSLEALGMKFTNTLTVKDASRAINSVKQGLGVLSHQRSVFGAYQNRLEHAYNINLNSEENTQYAESEIRDTDIARMMVNYANQSILEQAGVSMLTQANQQPNFILQLLQ